MKKMVLVLLLIILCLPGCSSNAGAKFNIAYNTKYYSVKMEDYYSDSYFIFTKSGRGEKYSNNNKEYDVIYHISENGTIWIYYYFYGFSGTPYYFTYKMDGNKDFIVIDYSSGSSIYLTEKYAKSLGFNKI